MPRFVSRRTPLMLLLMTCVVSSDARAQQSPEEDELIGATPAQLEMNEKAVQAAQRQEYAKAIQLFEASLQLGELNITYLNMGRTYAKMEECVKAKQTYRKARQTSYKIENPPPEVVNTALNEFESELYEVCPYGELVMTCVPQKLDLYVGERGPLECPGAEEPLRLKEGEYTLLGTFVGYEETEITVTVQRVDRVRATMTLARASEESSPVVKGQPEDPTPPEESARPSADLSADRSADRSALADAQLQANAPNQTRKQNIGAGVMLGLGAGILVGALAYDTCGFQWRNPDNRDAGYAGSVGPLCGPQINGTFDGADFIGPAGYLVGGVLMLTGLLRFEF